MILEHINFVFIITNSAKKYAEDYNFYQIKSCDERWRCRDVDHLWSVTNFIFCLNCIKSFYCSYIARISLLWIWYSFILTITRVWLARLHPERIITIMSSTMSYMNAISIHWQKILTMKYQTELKSSRYKFSVCIVCINLCWLLFFWFSSIDPAAASSRFAEELVYSCVF